MPSSLRALSLILFCLSPALLTQTAVARSAEAQEFTSDVSQTTLLELYTSEGCSSCPPADRWLTSLKAHPSLWKDFIPLAFHVEYWNYIGWEDRFSDVRFSKRQRRYREEGGVSAVYTPGFIANGAEWRDWFIARDRARLPQSSNMPGVLRLKLQGESYEANFTANTNDAPVSNDDLILNIAVLGMGLSSHVTRGENARKTLTHDFVVLHAESNTNASMLNDTNEWSGTLNAAVLQQGDAIVSWISRAGTLAPIQSTGGPINSSPDVQIN